MTKPVYDCSQQDLYSALDTMIDNYEDNLGAFTNFSQSYDAAVGTTGHNLVDAARQLPDENARKEAHDTNRVDLVALGKTCTDNFQFLQGYIRKAFAENLWKIKFDAAGHAKYASATNENWESVVSVNTSMKNFIAANVAALTAGNNMPGTFQAKVNTDNGNFKTKYDEFKSSKDTATAAEAKIIADNVAYNFVMKGFAADAPIIFKNSPTIADGFIFDKVRKSLGSHPAGVKGILMDADTSVRIAATLTAKKANEPAVVIVIDADGKLKKELSEGDYDFEVAAPDYLSQTGKMKISAGTVKRLNFKLKHV